MSDERGKLIKKVEKRTDDAASDDVEAHKLVKAQDEQDAESEPETPDVEAHKLVKKVTK
jgi:hypothetical protein